MSDIETVGYETADIIVCLFTVDAVKNILDDNKKINDVDCLTDIYTGTAENTDTVDCLIDINIGTVDEIFDYLTTSGRNLQTTKPPERTTSNRQKSAGDVDCKCNTCSTCSTRNNQKYCATCSNTGDLFCLCSTCSGMNKNENGQKGKIALKMKHLI